MATGDEYRWQGWRERFALPLEPVVIERCQHCTFEVSAPLEQARERLKQHQCDRPKPIWPARPREQRQSSPRTSR